MGIEIERKFLVTGDFPQTNGTHIRQGALPANAVRVRIRGERAYLTVKGPAMSLSRPEWEFEIPLKDAEEMLQLCQNQVKKTRFEIDHQGKTWEVDVFEGSNAGLIVAEVELESETEVIQTPSWVGSEVSHDSRYLNVNLGEHPYSTWGAEEEARRQFEMFLTRGFCGISTQKP